MTSRVTFSMIILSQLPLNVSVPNTSKPVMEKPKTENERPQRLCDTNGENGTVVIGSMNDKVRNEIRKYQNFNFVIDPDQKKQRWCHGFLQKTFKRISTSY